MSTDYAPMFISLITHSEKVPFILFYPWSNYRQSLLEYSKNCEKHGLLYYQIYAKQNTLAHWVLSLIDFISSRLPEFQVPQIDILLQDDPYGAGLTIADAFRSLTGEHGLLFLDSLDLVPRDERFRAFINGLALNSLGNWSIAITSRFITYEPWSDLIANKQAIVLGLQHERKMAQFALQKHFKPQLEYYGFADGQMLVNGQDVDNGLDAQAYRLIAYMIENKHVTRQQVLDVFWQDVSDKKGTNSFHVTKTSIVNALNQIISDGNKDRYELITHRNGIYRLSEDIVIHYDVSAFEEVVLLALQEEDEVLQERFLLQAYGLYQDEYLKSVTMDWVEDRRKMLQEMYLDVLIYLGKLYKRYGRDAKALQYYEIAFETDRKLEHVCRELMRLYAQVGKLDKVSQVFIRHQRALARASLHLDVETAEIYRMLMSQV